MSTHNPQSVVELDLLIAGETVASTSTRLHRDDISGYFQIPIYAGFQIGLNGVATDRAAAVLSALKALPGTTAPASNLLEVRISGTDYTLQLEETLRTKEIDIAPLIATLDGIVAINLRNNFIPQRDELLTGSDFPTDYESTVRVIAYYLPQFHPFPENDEWWGPGFTEWTNVVTAKSLFPGHYQPHIPADLGYYDLRIEGTQEKQIELAKRYGISGFCYYYYWFSGKKLMTMPIDRHVNHKYEMDFCLCWANENWSRRWDGSENDILMSQRHNEEDDANFIYSCIEYFRSERYIKINGAPLLQVYRISLLENPSETIDRWRRIVKSEGFPDIHVCMVESFGLHNPYEYGCDSSCQFPPHGMVGDNYAERHVGKNSDFTGNIYDYAEIVRSELARPQPPHYQFRGAMPSWDNTSRKGLAGNVFFGATPELFEAWVSHLAQRARASLPEEARFIFINAWNEWAEGAHLEPDRENGHANLTAVRNGITSRRQVIAALSDPATVSLTGQLLEEVRVLVQQMEGANEHLLACLKPLYGRYGWNVNWTSHYIANCEEFFEVYSAPEDSRAFLETLNGRRTNGCECVVIGLQQGLALSGWIHISDGSVPLWNSVPIFISLRDTSSGQRFIASIHDRHARPELSAHVTITERNLWCGFHVTTSLDAIPRGQYNLEVLVADASNLSRAVAVPGSLTVIIG